MDPITLEQEKKMMKAVGTGSSTEAFGGIAAVVLAIIGLAGIEPRFMLAIAGIVIGVSLLFESGTAAADYSEILANSGSGTSANVEVGGGVTSEMLAGAAAVVLGILALLDIVPSVLMSSTAIILGAGLLMGAGLTTRLNTVRMTGYYGGQEAMQRVARDAVSASAGGQVLIGLAGIVLGILALVGIASMQLNLVAMLALGAGVLLTGASVGTKMFTALRH